ncbi:unnamed protein product, partial [Protopolystoma xenopodis]
MQWTHFKIVRFKSASENATRLKAGLVQRLPKPASQPRSEAPFYSSFVALQLCLLLDGTADKVNLRSCQQPRDKLKAENSASHYGTSNDNISHKSHSRPSHGLGHEMKDSAMMTA